MVEHGCVQWETLRKNWEPMIRMGVCLLQRIGSHSCWAQSWPSKGLFIEKNVKKRACVSYKELGAIRVGPRVGHRKDFLLRKM